MPLKYPPEWKFDGFQHEMPEMAHREFIKLISMIAQGQENAKGIYEDFKTGFGVDFHSSSTSFAHDDMLAAMRSAKSNAALYVDSFYTGMKLVKESGIDVPDVRRINRILADNDVPLVIDLPYLNLIDGDFVEVAANEEVSLASMAFRKGDCVGKGGFGEVYEMFRKTKLGEYKYAMKFFEPISFIKNVERAGQRFEREMKVLQKLQHRGIVQMLECGTGPDQKPYILMPFIDGHDLRESLSGATPERNYRIFDEILNALDFAHRQGVVHRDLKPKNILVRASDDQPLILDFGAAYLLDDDGDSLTTTLIGTEAYVPDEVRRDHTNRSPKQDVYACGMLLYECIAHKLPDYNDYEKLVPNFPDFIGLDPIILRAIAPERKRTPSAETLRRELATLTR
jgi:serine/threonine protein kinase